MVKKYNIRCKECKAEFIVNYGSKNKRKNIFETYSCPKCKNLFSLSNTEQSFSCPNCDSTTLIRYNLNKEKNIAFYNKMFDEQLLQKEKYDEIMDFWNTVNSCECPKCGKNELVWMVCEK